MTGNPASRKGRGLRTRPNNPKNGNGNQGGQRYNNRSKTEEQRIAENAKRYDIHPDTPLDAWISELDRLGGLVFEISGARLDFSVASSANNPCGYEADILSIFDIQVSPLIIRNVNDNTVFFQQPSFKVRPRPKDFFTKWAVKYGFTPNSYVTFEEDNKVTKVSFKGTLQQKYMSLFKTLMFGMGQLERESFWGITPILPLFQEGWINPPKSPRNNITWKFVIPEAAHFRAFLQAHHYRWNVYFSNPILETQIASLKAELPQIVQNQNWDFQIPDNFKPRAALCQFSSENFFSLQVRETHYLNATPKQHQYLDQAIAAGSFGLYSNSFILLDSKGQPIFYRPRRLPQNPQQAAPTQAQDQDQNQDLNQSQNQNQNQNQNRNKNYKDTRYNLLMIQTVKTITITYHYRFEVHPRHLFLSSPRSARHQLSLEQSFLKNLRASLERYLKINTGHTLPTNYENIKRMQRGEPSIASISFEKFNDIVTKVQSLEHTVQVHGKEIHDHHNRLLQLEQNMLTKQSLPANIISALDDQDFRNAISSIKVAPHQPAPPQRYCLLNFFNSHYQVLLNINPLHPFHLYYFHSPETFYHIRNAHIIKHYHKILAMNKKFCSAKVSTLLSQPKQSSPTPSHDSDETQISSPSTCKSEDPITTSLKAIALPSSPLTQPKTPSPTLSFDSDETRISSSISTKTTEIAVSSPKLLSCPTTPTNDLMSPTFHTPGEDTPLTDKEQLRAFPKSSSPIPQLSFNSDVSDSSQNHTIQSLPSLPSSAPECNNLDPAIERNSPNPNNNPRSNDLGSNLAVASTQHSVFSPLSIRDPMLPNPSMSDLTQGDIRRHFPVTRPPAPIIPEPPTKAIKLLQPFDDVQITMGQLPHPIHLATLPSQPAVIIHPNHPQWSELSLEAKLIESLTQDDERLLASCFPSANLAKNNKLLCTPLSLAPTTDRAKPLRPTAASAGNIYIPGKGFKVTLSPQGEGRREWISLTLFKPLQTISLLSLCYLQIAEKYTQTKDDDLQVLRTHAELLTEIGPLLQNLWKLKISLERGTYFKTLPKNVNKLLMPNEWAKTIPAISEQLFRPFMELVNKFKIRKPVAFRGKNGHTTLEKLRAQYKAVSLKQFFETAPHPPHNCSMNLVYLTYPITTSPNPHISESSAISPNLSLLANPSSIMPTSDHQSTRSSLNSHTDINAPFIINPYFSKGDNLELQVIENINKANARWIGDTPAHQLNTEHPLLHSLVAPEHILACEQDLLIPKDATTILQRPAPAKKVKLSPLILASFGPKLKENLQINIEGELFRKVQNTSPPPLGTDFGIIYTNLNNPQTQLGPLFAANPRTAIFAVAELDIDPTLLKTEFTGLFHYTMFTHPPALTNTGPKVYAAIFIHHEIINKCKQIPLPAPFVSIYCTYEHFKFNVSCFYRPLKHSSKHLALQEINPKYDALNPDIFFLETLKQLVNLQFKVSAIICGDLNFQCKPLRKQDNSTLVSAFLRTTSHYKDQVDGHPTFRREHAKSSIDCFLTKQITISHVNFDLSGLHNDGHAVISVLLPYKINISPIIRSIIVRKQLSEVQINLISYLIYPYMQKILHQTEINSKCWFHNSISHTMHIIREDHKYGFLTSFNRENYKLPDSQAYSVILGTHLTFLLDLITPEQTTLVPFKRIAELPSNSTTTLAHVAQVISSHLISDTLDENTKQSFVTKFKQVKKAYHISLRKDRRKHLTRLKPDETSINDMYTINRRLHCKHPKTIDSENYTADELAAYFRTLQWKGANEKILRCTGIDIYKKWNIPSPARKLRFEEFIPTWDGTTKFNSVKLCFQTLKTHNQGHLTGYNKRFLSLLCEKFGDFLYNAVMSDILLGIYPQHYLTNKVKPIPKKDPKLGIKNHRFISVPDPLASLTGKTAAAMCITYTKRYKVWTPNQHGFLPKRGTTTAMAELILNLKDKPPTSPVLSASIDIKNGFGSPPFSTIMQGINKTAHENSANYFIHLLQPRRGIIYHNGERSEPVSLPMLGVPQGEPCSPWMFNLIMDGLKVILNHYKIRIAAYADDWFITFVGDPTESLQSLALFATKKLNEVTEFLYDLGMELNTSKSFFFVSSLHMPIPKISLKAGTLEHKTSFTHLGFKINKKLDSSDHFIHLTQKLIEMQQVVNNLLHLTNRQNALTFAYALIFGQLNYLAPIMPSFSNAQYNKIQRIIINTLHDILNIPLAERRELSYAITLNATGWLSFKNNLTRLKIKYLHDIFRAQDPFRLARIINLLIYQSDGSTKEPFQHYADRSNTKARVYFETSNHHLLTNIPPKELTSTFPFNAMILFNKLPEDIRDLFGHTSFVPILNLYFHAQCQHRAGKKHTQCKNCSGKQSMLSASFEQYQSMLSHLLNCNSLYEEINAMPLNMHPNDPQRIRLVAIESTLMEKIPPLFTRTTLDDVEYSYHALLRELQDKNIFPTDLNAFQNKPTRTWPED